MPSLKISNPFRRADGRPSLKERAAALRATAARVIRRPKPVEAEPVVDWSNPPEGFLAYPVDAPFGFIKPEEYLRAETQRLHDVALNEFARRKEAYEAGPNGMSGIELAGALDRLRRRLRLDELARAANPERALATEFTTGVGTIFYEDACGKAHQRPVAHWLSFMASRLYAVATAEENRAFNEAAGPDQEANRPLYDRLRRDLRLDALHALAFRSDEMFEAGKEYALGRGPLAGPVDQTSMPDPAAIALPELRALYDVADLLHELCHALKCQPRCWTHENGFKPAGDFVERLLAQCQEVMAACEDEAEQRKPADPYETDERLCILARMVIENGDSEQILAFARDVQAVA